MAHWLALTCATCRLVASRDASRTLVAPEFRISSWVITWIADGTSVNFFRTPGNGCYFQVHQLFHAELFQLTG